jgi:hypothetical protein
MGVNVSAEVVLFGDDSGQRRHFENSPTSQDHSPTM